MAARAPLPQLVNEVGDRIGLNYDINRKVSTRRYVEDNKTSHRLDYEQLKNSNYSLDESKTKKKSTKKDKQKVLLIRKNPLKLSSKRRKELYKLSPQDKQKLEYSTFEKVHELWKQYSCQVLCEYQGKDPMALFRMDLHGSYLKCIASKNPTLIGVEGIVVQETKNVFIIIKRTNGLITIPKKESLFEMIVGSNVYTIHGCNLLFTAQSRTKVKYKQKKSFSEI